MKAKLYFILAIFLILTWALPAMAQIYGQDQNVQGHVRRDGTFVQPHHRTAPDRDPYNNYSTQGNVNPWTGERGHVDPSHSSPGFGAPSPGLNSPHMQENTWGLHD